jgi:hypothetical protein
MRVTGARDTLFRLASSLADNGGVLTAHSHCVTVSASLVPGVGLFRPSKRVTGASESFFRLAASLSVNGPALTVATSVPISKRQHDTLSALFRRIAIKILRKYWILGDFNKCS